MVLDSLVSSPMRRSISARKQRDEMGSWSTLMQRHRFLLVALVLLTFLCTIYLYFAVTFASDDPCSEMTGSKKTLCELAQAKSHESKGKLKFF